jgi:hypothetical protein
VDRPDIARQFHAILRSGRSGISAVVSSLSMNERDGRNKSAILCWHAAH